MTRSLFVFFLFWGVPGFCLSLPLYTSREGRTCDNCHTLPNTWENPEDKKYRKCTMSCGICHVDPTGGGLRNAPGRFYGQSTLSLTRSTHRGYQDSVRFLFDGLALLDTPPKEAAQKQKAKALLEESRNETDQKKKLFLQKSEAAKAAQGEVQSASLRVAESEAKLEEVTAQFKAWLPRDWPPPEEVDQAEYQAWLDKKTAAEKALTDAQSALKEAQRRQGELDAELASAQAQYDDAQAQYNQRRADYALAKEALVEANEYLFTPAFGSPKGAPSRMDYIQGRYGNLNADPLLSLGADLRLASWTAAGATQVFPMQADVQAALQPVQHLTTYLGAGVLAKSQGFNATAEGDHPFAVKDAFLMAHELPANAYLKVGRFLPPFGTRLDDHTSFTRRDFELDQGLAGSRVFGAEIGIAPNYPYVNLAVFRPNKRDEFFTNARSPFFGEDGFGAALSAGYRDLGWQLGASAMTRRRGIESGGDTSSLSLQWGLNPWFYSFRLPFTYLGEYAFGSLQRPGSAQKTFQAAAFHELNYTPFNGINLRVKYDYDDPDFVVRDDHQHRFSVGGEVTLVPGVRLSATARWAVLPDNEVTIGRDLFMFLRLWL